MPVPSQITDGSFASAVQNGPGRWRHPFQDRGDTWSFEWIQPLQQDQATYLPWRNTINPFTQQEILTSISTARGTAYMVEETEPRHSNCGIMEFERVWASLPRTRIEGSSFSWPLQFTVAGGTEPNKVEELPLTLPAYVVYEYFLSRPVPLIAPRVHVVANTFVYLGSWTGESAGDWESLVAGTQVVGQDSEITIYKPGMYQRKTIYIDVPEYAT